MSSTSVRPWCGKRGAVRAHNRTHLGDGPFVSALPWVTARCGRRRQGRLEAPDGDAHSCIRHKQGRPATVAVEPGVLPPCSFWSAGGRRWGGVRVARIAG